MGGRNSGEEEEGYNYDLEQVKSSAEDHAAYKTIKSFMQTALAGMMNRIF